MIPLSSGQGCPFDLWHLSFPQKFLLTGGGWLAYAWLGLENPLKAVKHRCARVHHSHRCFFVSTLRAHISARLSPGGDDVCPGRKPKGHRAVTFSGFQLPAALVVGVANALKSIKGHTLC